MPVGYILVFAILFCLSLIVGGVVYGVTHGLRRPGTSCMCVDECCILHEDNH